ncbi:MAG: LysR family transcriptional regulator [Hyphomicrobiales bacterium]|nr:LysR family transcriptional regulator [Hyphomicrobiales bacterium]
MNKNTENHPFDTTAPSITRRAVDDAALLSGNYWGELRAFLCVAKTRSLTRAAEILGSSHATVGRDVRRLQDRMGSQLVIFTKSGTSLTEKGELLAGELLGLDQKLFAIENDLRSNRSDAEGLVRLAITDGLGAVFVVPELRRIARDYPKIRIHVKTPGHLRDIRENQTDVMLAFAPENAAEFLSKPLGWLHFLPIASADYVARKGLPRRATLANHVFVDSELYSARGGPWEPWHELKSEGLATYHCDPSISYGMMVKAGLGIGLLGNYNLTEPNARPLDLGLQISLRLYAVVLKERLESRPVRVVFNMIEDIFGEHNPWFAQSMNLSVPDSRYNEGYRLLFNLP